MCMLFRLITERRIGAVACQDEDRLFRDETQVQVDLFVEACRSAGVLVLTPTTRYDFNHATDGEACEAFLFPFFSIPPRCTTVSQSRLPVARS